MYRRRTTLSVACAVAALATAASAILAAAPAAAKPARVAEVHLNSFESVLLKDMNRARRQHGLHPLRVTAGTTDVARRWAWHLADQQSLEHNPHLLGALSHAGSGSWRAIEENVGYGPAASPAELFQAYMHSPEHRANILGRDVRYVGVGVVQRGQYAWNTVDFVDRYATSYGATRVPADGIATDAMGVTTSTLLASGRRPDLRFGATASGKVSASRVHFSHGAASARLQGNRGHAGLIFRQALALTGVHQLRLRLSAVGRHHVRVPVAVELGDGWHNQVVRTVHVTGTKTVTVDVPATAARRLLTTVAVVVNGHGLRAAGRRLVLSVSDIRAVV